MGLFRYNATRGERSDPEHVLPPIGRSGTHKAQMQGLGRQTKEQDLGKIWSLHGGEVAGQLGQGLRDDVQHTPRGERVEGVGERVLRVPQ